MDDFCSVFTSNQIKSAVNIRTAITTPVTVSSSPLKFSILCQYI